MSYQEKGSTFRHGGRVYDLNFFLRKAERLPIEQLPIEDFQWIIDVAKEEDVIRIERADYLVPILVTKWQGKWVPIDGWHRLLKAYGHNIGSIKVKKIPKDWFTMRGAEIKHRQSRARIGL